MLRSHCRALCPKTSSKAREAFQAAMMAEPWDVDMHNVIRHILHQIIYNWRTLQASTDSVES